MKVLTGLCVTVTFVLSLATGAQAVRLRWPPSSIPAPRLALEDVVDPGNGHHHDPARLAAALMKLYDRESGSRRRSGVARTA